MIGFNSFPLIIMVEIILYREKTILNTLEVHILKEQSVLRQC